MNRDWVPDWFCRLLPDRRPTTRVMVVSTPRSGNSWLRRMLATLYGWSPAGGTELCAHRLDDFPWGHLPPGCAMQLHWHPDRAIRARFRADRVRPLVIHRHPLDVLISVLQLARHTPETGMWLLGEGGDEAPIRGVEPTSDAFHRYATGPRAAALLSVSCEWAAVRGTLTVGYEDLVRDPIGGMTRLSRALRPMPAAEIARAVDACTLDRLRNPDNAPHFWQGKPGHWRRLVPASLAREIADAHPRAFSAFGYACDPDPDLTFEQASAHWRDLMKTSIELRGAA